jgi:acylphosphatase
MGQYKRYIDYYTRKYSKWFPAAQVMSREDYDKLQLLRGTAGYQEGTPEGMVQILAEFDNEECSKLAKDIKEYHCVS